jgi:multimeric flavodoxin WrbA
LSVLSGCRDDLTPVLAEAVEADFLLMASPIYFNDVTGMLRLSKK